MARIHLRTRVLLLTTAFAIALFGITYGLSWQGRRAHERWTQVVSMDVQAVSTLEELIRAHNTYRARLLRTGPRAARRYETVVQLLEHPALRTPDTDPLRKRMSGFRQAVSERRPLTEIEARAIGVDEAAQRLIESRRRQIALELPQLERESRWLITSAMAIAWMIVIVSFAVVQTTLRRVVRPIEELSSAADRIAGGDLSARAPVAGDHEIARLGGAFNRMADELKARARTDDLTALPNFRAFRERIDGEIDRAGRYREQFGVLILDLDRFKHYNDTYGHLAGNGALQRVAAALRESVRSVDFPARYGGEEFAVIVPLVDLEALHRVAERVRAAVEAMPGPIDGAPVTVSIGGSLFPVDGAAVEELFQVADQRLYQAKREGRNRVVVTSAAPAARSAG